MKSSVELLEHLARVEVELLHADGDGSEDDVLLELGVVPHSGLKGFTPHYILVYTVFQHLHET